MRRKIGFLSRDYTTYRLSGGCYLAHNLYLFVYQVYLNWEDAATYFGRVNVTTGANNNARRTTSDNVSLNIPCVRGVRGDIQPYDIRDGRHGVDLTTLVARTKLDNNFRSLSGFRVKRRPNVCCTCIFFHCVIISFAFA